MSFKKELARVYAEQIDREIDQRLEGKWHVGKLFCRMQTCRDCVIETVRRLAGDE